MPFIGNQPAKVPLTSADITDGIITSAKIADGTIVNADISASAGIVASKLSGAGITEADQWRLSANVSIPGADTELTTNLERNDSTGFSVLGTGMTQSSGVFTFPSTGYWWINFIFYALGPSADNTVIGKILVTTNNSTYTAVTENGVNQRGFSSSATGVTNFIFDVTSTTNCKVKFLGYAGAADASFLGDTAINKTHFTFIKLGDT